MTSNENKEAGKGRLSQVVDMARQFLSNKKHPDLVMKEIKPGVLSSFFYQVMTPKPICEFENVWGDATASLVNQCDLLPQVISGKSARGPFVQMILWQPVKDADSTVRRRIPQSGEAAALSTTRLVFTAHAADGYKTLVGISLDENDHEKARFKPVSTLNELLDQARAWQHVNFEVPVTMRKSPKGTARKEAEIAL